MKTTLLPAAILLATLTAPAHAGVTVNANYVQTTYLYSGVLIEPFGTLPTGTPFQGSFTYDSGQPLNYNGTRGIYTTENISITILGQTVSDSGTAVMNIYNNYVQGVDMLDITPSQTPGSFGGIPLDPTHGFSLFFIDDDGSVFDSSDVLKPNVTRADFASGTIFSMRLVGAYGSGTAGSVPIAMGQVTYMQAVPEPSTLLGTLTLGSLAFLRRRR